MSIKWLDYQDHIEGSSICHTDGDHFSYCFTKHGEVWRNDSEHELCLPDSPKSFSTIDEAKWWAEEQEKGWVVLGVD